MLNTDASDKDKLRFLQEAAIMCQFDHQNVIKLHGVVTETPAMIVLEYMRHGDLRNMLMQLQPVSVKSKLNYVMLITKIILQEWNYCSFKIATYLTKILQRNCSRNGLS